MDDALLDGSLEEAALALRSRSVAALELTEASLTRIAAREPELNAFITVTGDDARRRARAADGRGALAGAPIALKDLFDVAGVPTTGGSKIFATNVPAVDGEIARRLFGAGGIDIGKISPKISKAIVAKVQAVKQAIAAGKIKNIPTTVP